ncbi:hypothetical protein FB599_1796 [Herbaspirillum sp. SJZ130]|nr:hypothetical protein FB599_1796 [Herbaspirillum sp. SJZ130]TQK13883.1 hypothetical protein FB598_1246 [Herbaspirillum sp. SJZ106]
MTACVLTAPAIAEASSDPLQQTATTMTGTIQIRITTNDAVLTAELESSAAAQDFAAMLPLSVELTDYNRTEKIAQLPRGLSTAGSPEGFTPKAGDIAFYAPWGNLAIFYKGFGYSKGLVKLGRIQGDAGMLGKMAPQQARIERK